MDLRGIIKSSRANDEIYDDTTTLPWTAEEDRSIIHRFSFNTEAFGTYFGTYNGRCMVLLSTCWFPTYCCNLFCAPTFLRCEKLNAHERARALFVALSKKGILFAVHAYKQVCRCRCCSEVGEKKVFIPYEDITRVEFVVMAPSKARCCCGGGCLVGDKTLEKVEIYTKRGVSRCRPELVLWFLNDPQDFVDLVQTMMYKPQRPSQPPSVMSMDSRNSSCTTPRTIGVSSSDDSSQANKRSHMLRPSDVWMREASRTRGAFEGSISRRSSV